MNASTVVATIKPKASAEIIEELMVLFNSYDVPFGDGSEARRDKVKGYVWACEGRPVALVKRVVRDFVTGEVKRSPSLRSKLPTAEEFAAQLKARASEGADAASIEARTFAPAFGPLWGIKLIALLLAGPDRKVEPSAFFAAKIAEGGATGERYRLLHQASYGFCKAGLMIEQAERAQGRYVEASLADLVELMEPVPVNGDVYAAWHNEFEARGWPWLPNTGKQRVVYLPRGGPEGLASIAAVLKRATGGASELSTVSRDRRGEVRA